MMTIDCYARHRWRTSPAGGVVCTGWTVGRIGLTTI